MEWAVTPLLSNHGISPNIWHHQDMPLKIQRIMEAQQNIKKQFGWLEHLAMRPPNYLTVKMMVAVDQTKEEEVVENVS